MAGDLPEPTAGQTHLQQIIAGLTEGVIIVESDGRIAWANDTALALHGVRRMPELGETVAEYRRRFQLTYLDGHRLPAREYPMDRLLAGEAFAELMVRVVRSGETRHWIHELRTMVLTDAAGSPDCLVLIINDETERFSAEERFERAFAANPAPAIIARLADMRYVKVNQGFLEMTGYQRDALIGRSMHDFDVLKDADKRDLAIRRLHAGQTIPQMEGCLAVADGSEKMVLIGGQPLEIGDAACMLFTFADLHARHQAQHALRQSEQRFAKAFQLAPGPMAILALDGLCILDVNIAFTAATGWRREEVVGRSESELEIWGRRDQREALERELRHTGHLRSVDVQLRAKGGAVGDFLLSAETVEINDRQCVLSVMLDITERRQTEMELLAAIEAVMQDTSWIGQKIVEKLAAITRAGPSAAPTPEIAALPQRLREVLDLLAGGLADDDIASRLRISRNTVRNHVSAIFARLGIRKRSALVVWARERGLGAAGKSRITPQKTKQRKSG